MIKESIPDDTFIVLVTGDRLWTNIEIIASALSSLPSNSVIIHGYANGADTIADVVGTELGYRVVRCPAHWRHNERKCVEVWGWCPTDCCEVIGRSAGQIRNQLMYTTYHPDVIFGFHNNILESKGTKGMMAYGHARNTETWLYSEHTERILNPDLTKPRKKTIIPPTLVDSMFDV